MDIQTLALWRQRVFCFKIVYGPKGRPGVAGYAGSIMSINRATLVGRLTRVRRTISEAGRRLMKRTRRAPVLRALLRPSLSYSIIRDEASFDALEPEWEDIFGRAVGPTPFMRYSWLRLCWNYRRVRSRLYIVIVRKHNRPVLIAPLIRRGSSLTFLDSATPQYNDVLVEESEETSKYVEFFWRILLNRCSGRNLVSKWVRDDSPIAPLLAAAPQEIEPTSYKAAFIDIGKFGDWETYLQSLSAKLRQGYRRRLRNLQKRGTVEFRRADASTCSSDMAWIFNQKRQWLDRRGKSGRWLREAATEELFTAAAREGIESGHTWLTVLSVNGATIAASLAFQQSETLYGSKDAYDPAWHEFSPGRMLKFMTFERAFQNGIGVIDLMTGRYPWKDEFATGKAGVANRRIGLSVVKHET
jgi:CelD/BcsL family acetyltransferase involved in cellulose biosynthesis